MSKAIITEQHLHDIADAIIAKGGATGPMTPAQMPAAIQSIQSGGGYEKWTEPDEWPDVKSILESDTTQGFTNKIIALFDISNGKTWTLPKKGTAGADRYLTSDGSTYEVSSSDITHTFGDSGIVEGKWAWVIMYSNSTLSALIRNSYVNPVVFYYGSDGSEFAIGYMSYRSPVAVIVDRMLEAPQALYYANGIECLRCKTFVPTGIPSSEVTGFFAAFSNKTFYEITFKYVDLTNITEFPNTLYLGFFGGHFAVDVQCVKVIPEVLDVSKCTNCYRMFAACGSLPRVPDVLDLSACTNCGYMFNGCASLRAVPDILDLSACTNCQNMFARCYSLTKVPDVLDLSACTNCQNMFYECYSLTKVPDILDLSACTNCQNMFYECYSLTKVPDILDLSACTNCQNMFARCYSLTKVPDVLDLSACTNCQNMFNGCYGLRRIPTHVTTNLGISFANSKLVSRDSVAVFDANGNVVGGFVGNLNTKPSEAGTQTIALNSDIKSIFNTDEWTAIKTCLTDKGWAVTPA